MSRGRRAKAAHAHFGPKAVKPDFDQIAPKLYIGAVPADCVGFDVVVLCAMEHQGVRLPCYVIRVPLDDAKPTHTELALAVGAAEQVHRLRKSGRRVLVTCHAGVNRSSLVAAIALILDGMQPADAISLIQRRRQPDCGLKPLCNTHFVDALLRMRRRAA